MDNWALLDDYPPGLVRLLARNKLKGKRIEAKADEEVAVDAQLPVTRIQEISQELSWDNVLVKDMRAFCRGCDFDPNKCSDRNRAKAYYNQPGGAKFTYLKISPWWESTFLPIIRNLQENAHKLP